MNERQFEILNERLTRMEDRLDEKLDQLLEQHADHRERLSRLETTLVPLPRKAEDQDDKLSAQATRITKLETQASTLRGVLGIVGTFFLAAVGWIIDHIKV